jgi:4'-phosphopantetheinyl transferase
VHHADPSRKRDGSASFRTSVRVVGGHRDEAHALLRAEVGAVALGRLCPRCGSAAHGRPWVRVADDLAPSVSLSYVDDLAVVAWSWDAPVGVDVERADADAGIYGDALVWTRAEAVLKATGEGLLRDPADLPVRPAEPLHLGAAYVGWVAWDVPPSQASRTPPRAGRATQDRLDGLPARGLDSR